MEDALVLMDDYRIGLVCRCLCDDAMMRQKLCWRRYANVRLLLACGATEEGRTEIVIVKPEAIMMDGSSRLVTCFENWCVVLVGWMHCSR